MSVQVHIFALKKLFKFQVRRLEKLCSAMEARHAADMAALRRELDAERAARAALEQQVGNLR